MSVPTRHPQRPGPVPGAIRLLAGLLGLGEPDQDQWRRLGERLTIGDEAADRLLDSDPFALLVGMLLDQILARFTRMVTFPE